MKRIFCAGVAVIFGFIGAHAQPDTRGSDLVQAGKIRIGVFPSFQYSKGDGLALRIARELADKLGIREVVTVEHATPPQVIACVTARSCDLGFMLIDPARATEVDFTPAFVKSDFTYLVPENSPIRNSSEVDRKGMRVAAVKGHASTFALGRIVKQATPVFVEDYDAAVEALRSGKADAFASIREVLLQYSQTLAGARLLDDGYQTNFAGIIVAKGNDPRLSYVSDFLEQIKRSGSLQRMIDDLGIRGIQIER